MTSQERGSESSQTPEQVYQDFISSVDVNVRLFAEQHAQNPLKAALERTIEQSGMNLDKILLLTMRQTRVPPSQIRSIVGGSLSWDTWTQFKLALVTDITKHEINSRTTKPSD